MSSRRLGRIGTRNEAQPEGVEVDINANDVVAFLVELVVLALLGLAGFGAGGAWAWVLGIGLPVATAVVWGLFAAPRARVSSAGLRLGTKLVVLGAGVGAGFVVLPLVWAYLFAVVVVLNVVLMYVGPFSRR
jgi:Protein of unknown function (DUF2568)